MDGAGESAASCAQDLISGGRERGRAGHATTTRIHQAIRTIGAIYGQTWVHLALAVVTGLVRRKRTRPTIAVIVRALAGRRITGLACVAVPAEAGVVYAVAINAPLALAAGIHAGRQAVARPGVAVLVGLAVHAAALGRAADVVVGVDVIVAELTRLTLLILARPAAVVLAAPVVEAVADLVGPTISASAVVYAHAVAAGEAGAARWVALTDRVAVPVGVAYEAARAGELARPTGGDAESSPTFIVRRAGRGRALVDLAIAIIVLEVAHLGGGADLSIAYDLAEPADGPTQLAGGPRVLLADVAAILA